MTSHEMEGVSSVMKNFKTVKLLQCKGCGEMVSMGKNFAILHYESCQIISGFENIRRLKPKVKKSRKSDTSPKPVTTDIKVILKKCEYPETQKEGRRRPLKRIHIHTTTPTNKSNSRANKKKQLKMHLLMANAPVRVYDKGCGRIATLPFSAFRCVVCFQRFGQVTKLKAHLLTHSIWKAAKNVTSRKSPLLILQRKLRYPCSWNGCRRAFRTLAYLHLHKLSHTSTFKSVRARAVQRWVGEGIKNKLEFKSRWRISIKNDKKIFKCVHCPCGFRKFTTFKRHLVVGGRCQMKRRKTFKCIKSRKDRGARLVSTYLKKHSCPEIGCYKKFPTKLHLSCHTRQDHFEPFQNLRLHVLNTLKRELTMVPCPHCPEDQPRKFKTKKDLRNHCRAVHVEYKCTYCPERVRGLQNFIKHKLLHPRTIINYNLDAKDTDTERYKKSLVCPHPRCGMTFIFTKSLNAHLATHGRLTNDPTGEEVEEPEEEISWEQSRSNDKKSMLSKCASEIAENNWNVLPQIKEDLSFRDYVDNDEEDDGCQFTVDYADIKMEVEEEEEFYSQPQNNGDQEFIVGI